MASGCECLARLERGDPQGIWQKRGAWVLTGLAILIIACIAIASMNADV